MSLVTEGQLREIVALRAYRDPEFRRQLLRSPKATIEGLIGMSLGSVGVSIVADTETNITMVIPPLAGDETSLF